MRRFAWWRVTVAVLALCAMTLSLRFDLAAAEPALIKIATQSPLSGNQASLGGGVRNGAQLAVEHLSRSIANLGFRVLLVPLDDRARVDVGIANAKKLVADPEVALVIGHLNAAVAIPSSEVYRDGGLAMISPANTDPRLTSRRFPNLFRVVGRDDVQGAVAAEFAKRRGARTAYILHEKAEYGLNAAEAFRGHAAKIDLAIVGFEETTEKSDFAPIITAVLARKPDVVYFGGDFTQGGVFFKQARAKNLEAAFMGPDGMDSDALVKIAGDAVVGMHHTAIVGPVSVYPRAAQFAKDYKTRFGGPPEPFAVQAYDATAIGLRAIERAVRAAGHQRPARAQVISQIRALTAFQGLTGVFTFDHNGDAVPATYFVVRVSSADPAKWKDNRLVQTISMRPPGSR